MKQRLNSSYCAKNGYRQEKRKPKTDMLKSWLGWLGKICFSKDITHKANKSVKSCEFHCKLFCLLVFNTFHLPDCNFSIQITLLHLWPLLPSASIVDSKHSANRVKALLCGEVKATWPAYAYSTVLHLSPPPPAAQLHHIYSCMYMYMSMFQFLSHIFCLLSQQALGCLPLAANCCWHYLASCCLV